MGFRQKFKYSFLIIRFVFKTYPVRIYRVVKHVLPFRYKLGGELSFPLLVFEWFLSLLLFITDLFLLPEFLCILFLFLKKEIRGLTPKEKEIQEQLFEGKLRIPILLNEDAAWMTRKGKFAFVSFYVINSYGSMDDRTFAHELIHIYQYSRYGSPYIIRALMAQNTKSGYNYGGIKYLTEIYASQLSQGHLNYEQQGEVLADYYMLICNKEQLSKTKYLHLIKIYEYVIKQWRKKEIYRW